MYRHSFGADIFLYSLYLMYKNKFRQITVYYFILARFKELRKCGDYVGGDFSYVQKKMVAVSLPMAKADDHS